MATFSISVSIPRRAKSAAPCNGACYLSATACCQPKLRWVLQPFRAIILRYEVRGRKAIALLRAGGHTGGRHQRRLGERNPDPRPEQWTKQGRQFAVIDAKGNTAVYTGPKATAWAGHKQGKSCTAQGNILAGKAVLPNMVKAFEETTGSRYFSMRLMAALDAGQAAGSDKRGMQSANVLIVGKGKGVWLNNDVVMRLQVDGRPEPVKEMRRMVEAWNQRREKDQAAAGQNWELRTRDWTLKGGRGLGDFRAN